MSKGAEYLPTAGRIIKRKIVKIGESSYGVILPKWWVTMQGLDKEGSNINVMIKTASQLGSRAIEDHSVICLVLSANSYW